MRAPCDRLTMAKILLQTTIIDVPDDWNVGRFFRHLDAKVVVERPAVGDRQVGAVEHVGDLRRSETVGVGRLRQGSVQCQASGHRQNRPGDYEPLDEPASVNWRNTHDATNYPPADQLGYWTLVWGGACPARVAVAARPYQGVIEMLLSP
jgi:hypothetical protein